MTNDENYIILIKTLSAKGFVWNKGAQAWLRKEDDGGFTEESLRNFVECWPVLVPRVVLLLERGAKGIKFSHIENTADVCFIRLEAL